MENDTSHMETLYFSKLNVIFAFGHYFRKAILLHSSSSTSEGQAHERPPFGVGKHKNLHPPLFKEHVLDPGNEMSKIGKCTFHGHI